MPFRIYRYPFFILVGSMLSLVMLLIFTFRQFREYETQTHLVERSYQVMQTLQHVKDNFMTESALRRGYVITPTEETLHDMREVRNKIFLNLDSLHQLVADNPLQLQNAGELSDLLHDPTMSMNRWENYTVRDSLNRLQLIRDDIRMSISFRRQDPVLQNLQRMLAHESRQFVKRSGFQSESAQLTPYLIVSLTSVALLFLLYTFFQIQRELNNRLKVQLNLQKSLQELQEKNLELERFSFLTAHHLNEPLRKALTFISRLRDRELTAAEQQQMLERTELNLLHQSQLLHDLNRYVSTFQQQNEAKEVDLNRIWKQSVKTLQPLISEQKAVVKLENDLPVVTGYAAQLQYLFDELLSNALKFHQPGTVPRIQVSATRDASTQNHEIRISDHGIGFDPQHARKIFDLFERLHSGNQYAGTGIGLALCRRIMQQHDGQISATATPGAGSVFLLTFPDAGFAA